MQVAVASQNRREVTGHVGVCRRFWLYQIEAGEVRDKKLLELAKEQSFHESHGGEHALDHVQAVIGGGMGAGLVRRLARKGIEAIVTPEVDPDIAVRAFISGTLARKEPEVKGEHEHGGCACGDTAS